ncbi:MAG: PLP-dependent transferase [Actinomycetota bacterium]|nr:PLP-dependent transferase [Actinomycetota bacterium]
MREDLDPSTQAILAGRADRIPGGPLSVPPVLASSFHAGSAQGYSRDGNPTWQAFEAAIGALEGGTAVSFSSGMAATAAILEGLPPTGRVVMAEAAYSEVREMLAERQAAGRLRATFADAMDTEAIIAALPGADMLWLDSISNPYLDVPELDVLAQAAHDEGALVVVDATLVTPILQRPLSLGADLVVHSATKAIGGHSDLLLGVAVARTEAGAGRLDDARTMFGAVPGTLEAWLALRGLRTLPLRIEHAQSGASLLAADLAERDDVQWIRFPGLPGDPSRATAERLMDGPGTMLSFELDGGMERAEAVCESVEIITHAASLGGVETLIERHGRWCSAADVSSGLLRLSVGCEHPGDLWRDLDRALDATSALV